MTTPGGALVVTPAKDGSRLYFEATWRHAGRSVKRRLGVAWLQQRPEPVVGLNGWQRRYVKRSGNPTGSELTPQQATVAMRDLIKARAATAPTAGRPRSFREAAAAWLDDPYARPHRWARETEIGYRSMLAEPGAAPKTKGQPAQGRLMAAFGAQRVDQITAEHIHKFLRALDAEGLSSQSANRYHVVISQVLSDAAGRGWRTGNPAKTVAKRRLPHAAELTVFTVAQVEAIATAAGGELGALIIVAAMTGLRRGELVALRWRDVRFEQPALHVERAVSAGHVKRPKSGKGRFVPLADRPLAVLRELAGRVYFTAPDDLVFARADGGLRDPDAVTHAYAVARDAAGVPALRFHDLRHTFGSLLATAGVSAFELQRAMGHSSITTTQRYMHFAPQADAAARFTAALAVK